MEAAAPLKVHLFKVRPIDGTRPLADTLIKISQLSLPKRMAQAKFQPMRLECLDVPPARPGLWRLDFCKLRTTGPGKASASEPTRGFDMAEEDRFSEESAAIYDERSGYIAIQYNHYGPRATTIEDYLSVFAGQGLGYHLDIQLDPSVQARLARKTIFSKFAYRVAPARLSSHWRNLNVSLARALTSQQDAFGGDWVSVEVSLERRSKPTLKLVDRLSGILGLTQESTDAVAKLEVYGKDDGDSLVEKIDLLHGKLVMTFENLSVDIDRRVPRDLRWACLESSLYDWMGRGIVR